MEINDVHIHATGPLLALAAGLAVGIAAGLALGALREKAAFRAHNPVQVVPQVVPQGGTP